MSYLRVQPQLIANGSANPMTSDTRRHSAWWTASTSFEDGDGGDLVAFVRLAGSMMCIVRWHASTRHCQKSRSPTCISFSHDRQLHGACPASVLAPCVAAVRLRDIANAHVNGCSAQGLATGTCLLMRGSLPCIHGRSSRSSNFRAVPCKRTRSTRFLWLLELQ